MNIWKFIARVSTKNTPNLFIVTKYHFRPNSINFNQDFYKILSLRETASASEIKAAFYKLAKEYHPDKNKGKEQKFKEINEAYEVLGDEAKRKEYDSMRRAGASETSSTPFSTAEYARNSRQTQGQPQKDEKFYYYWEETTTNGGQKKQTRSGNFGNNANRDFGQEFMSETLKKMFNETMQNSKMGKQMGTGGASSSQFNDHFYRPNQTNGNGAPNTDEMDPRWTNVNKEAREFYQKQMQEKIQEEFKEQMEYEHWKRHKQAQMLKDVEQKVADIQKQVTNVTQKLGDGINIASKIFSHAWTQFNKQ